MDEIKKDEDEVAVKKPLFGGKKGRAIGGRLSRGTMEIRKDQRAIHINVTDSVDLVGNITTLKKALMKEFGTFLSYQQTIGIAVKEAMDKRGVLMEKYVLDKMERMGDNMLGGRNVEIYKRIKEGLRKEVRAEVKAEVKAELRKEMEAAINVK